MPILPKLKERIRRAEGARGRPAPFGPDVDLDRYPMAPEAVGEGIPDGLREAALDSGVDITGRDQAGTYLQADRTVLCRRVSPSWEGKVEVLPMGEALGKHRWLQDYRWRTVAADSDKYTARVALSPAEGYFIRILPGQKIDLPLQSCLLMERGGTMQCVHNIIIAEEGSEASIIAGCATSGEGSEGLHLGVSEFIIGAGASLSFTMIHNWGEGFHVRPRSAALVEEGGTFVSNYILMRPVRSLQMYPSTFLRGEKSRARFQAVLYGKGDSVVDVGSRVVLEGRGCRAETLSRVIASERSSITARGRLEARTGECRAHLDCRGMLISRQALVHAVPELEAAGVPEAELSHEAAISPVAEEEIAYLMSRGLNREEALAVITRGFLNVELLGLPPRLRKAVEAHLASTTAEGGGL